MKHDLMKEMLAISDIDLAVGMTDTFVTKYGRLHHRINRDIYKGEGDVESLDLKYNYDITEPLKFDFTPIDNADSKVKRTILRDPYFRNDKALMRESFDVPTLRLLLPNTNLNFKEFGSGANLGQLRLSLEVEAYLFVTDNSPKRFSIRVISTNINIEEQNLLVDAVDDSGCALDKLIEHILEHILKERLNRFIQTIDLPQPQDIITVFDTELRKAEILDNHLYLGLHAIPARHTEKSISIADTNVLLEELFEDTERLDSIQSQKNPESGMEYLTTRVPATMEAVDVKSLAVELPAGDIFVAFSESAFQIIGDEALNIYQQEEEREDNSSWYYYLRSWVKVWNPVVKLRKEKLDLRADLAGGAEGEAGLKKCSSWVNVKIGGKLRPTSVNVQANFFVRGKEFWLWPRVLPSDKPVVDVWVRPKIPGLDEILSIIATSITSIFFNVVLPIITLNTRKKLFVLPSRVPGTDISMNATFSEFGNWESMLFASVVVEFPDQNNS